MAFEDNRIRVINAINEKAIAFLEESGGELEAQVIRNCRENSGQLKGSWTHKVDESKKEVMIGSPLQNAIWEEFGTGEHAIHGDGRKGGWSYQDIYGKWHRTRGKKPSRALQRAFDSRKSAIARIAKEKFGVELR